jgi:hypothetical protein
MWRVISQYMDTMNGPADFLEVPVNPITGTKFENAKLHQDGSHRRVYRRPDQARQAGTGPQPKRQQNRHLPRFLQPGPGHGHARRAPLRDQNVANNFYDMPANTIREQTFCCGSGSGLNAGEDMELRMAGGFPRANAVKYVTRNMGSTCWPPSAPSTGRPCPHPWNTGCRRWIDRGDTNWWPTP